VEVLANLQRELLENVVDHRVPGARGVLPAAAPISKPPLRTSKVESEVANLHGETLALIARIEQEHVVESSSNGCPPTFPHRPLGVLTRSAPPKSEWEGLVDNRVQGGRSAPAVRDGLMTNLEKDGFLYSRACDERIVNEEISPKGERCRSSDCAESEGGMRKGARGLDDQRPLQFRDCVDAGGGLTDEGYETVEEGDDSDIR